MKKETIVVNNTQELAKKAASKFTELAEQFINNKGSFNVALAGGGTPQQMHQVLASYSLDWSRINILFSDERYVAPTAENSNFYLAYNSLLKNIAIPNENIMPILTLGTSAKDSAKACEILGVDKVLFLGYKYSVFFLFG